MPFDFSIPQTRGTSLRLVVRPGEILFLLGANGTGKSSLMHHFYRAHQSNSRRITAHRQTWFASNAITLSPQQKQQTESHIRSSDINPDARWRDDYAAHRASIAVYDLVDSENIRARSIACSVDAGNMDLAKELSKRDAPIKVINELLRLSNIPIAIEIHEDAQVIARKNDSEPYSIAKLSDGERNALLIAANVLTAKAGTLLLIDEPERHLHRSIISPLLSLLFKKRSDCAFVISTHDVMLPLDNPGARTLLIRGCAYNGSAVTSWDVDPVPPKSGIDDDLKRDILGARRKILFIEGTDRSLDQPLYSLIFPDVSVVSKGSCRDVEHAVASIRDAEDLHWLEAFGLVDNDRRSQADIDRLKDKGVYATEVFAVESIYYHPDIQRLVAGRLADSTGGQDAETRVANARAAAIGAIGADHARHLSVRVAEKAIREEFFRRLPKREEIVAATPINVSIDVAAAVSEERDRLEKALVTSDLATIIRRYPVRETPALTEIARKLGFQSGEQYEEAVRKLLMDDADALVLVRSLFGTLAEDIMRGCATTGADIDSLRASTPADARIVA